MRTLRVRGTGRIKQSPDLAVIKIRLNGNSKDYTVCSNILNNKIKELNKDIQKIGFDKKELKAISLEINSRFETVEEVRVFKEFEAESRFILKFDFISEKLTKVIETIANSKAEPEISIEFEIKDKEKFKNDLIEKAVLDSKLKAEKMSKAAGVKLGDIQSIDYSWSEIRMNSNFIMEESYCCSASSEFELEPEEINASDDVTVVWEIK